VSTYKEKVDFERFRNLSAMTPEYGVWYGYIYAHTDTFICRDNEVRGYRIFGGCLYAESGCAHEYQI
jgi:hypothetical protein